MYVGTLGWGKWDGEKGTAFRIKNDEIGRGGAREDEVRVDIDLVAVEDSAHRVAFFEHEASGGWKYVEIEVWF